ncbi:hypothetical protein RIF23_18490 [Lipingzhangella sp. LS1_29]|uniref:Uncharacterized protein n=1 Tax=Lipingzhangella rawalii TaxID=2055835 RepID=A0ABU2HBB6_9ACTN|nr:hypothetical protein [Lipingzhangella rawalii]MDS1272282.1 hypothetical protein [Lipingzhangella rawalii]
MTTMSNAYAVVRRACTGPGTLTRAAATVMILATVATQHHLSSFNRIQRKDLFFLIPNWRFFAPNPGVYDFHIIYRVRNDGQISGWRGIDMIANRRSLHTLWHPKRRREKAVFDIANGVALVLDKGFDVITRTPDYRLLSNFVAATVRADDINGNIEGYQFALARSAGYESTKDPEIVMVAPYTTLSQ